MLLKDIIATIRYQNSIAPKHEKPIIVHVAFPSGRIVIADDLRPTFEVPIPADRSYNYFHGQKAVTQAYAQLGCAYGSTDDVGTTVVMDAAGDMLLGDFLDTALENDILPSGTHAVAKTCANLWAYSIADYQLWQSRGGIMNENITVVDVTPGMYRLTHYASDPYFDMITPGSKIYARLERVQNPTTAKISQHV